MAMLLVVVLLSCVWSAGSQTELMKLSDSYKAGVELALKQINTHPGVQQHFLFFRSHEHSNVDVGFGAKVLYHHFFLKATQCRKGTADVGPTKCAFRNDRPQIDCVTCYKTFNDAIEENPKPYIHCVHKPTLTKDIMAARRDHCEKMSYSSGSASVLTVRRNA